MNLAWKEPKIASDVTAPLPVTRGIERTFSRPFSETFRISKNEDFSGPYLENENEFLKNSFETVFRASKSCDRDQLVSAFQLTFKPSNSDSFSLGPILTDKKVQIRILEALLENTYKPLKSANYVKNFVVLSESPFKYYELRSPFTISWYLLKFNSYWHLKVEKWCKYMRGLG